jgi:hypothetical protein
MNLLILSEQSIIIHKARRALFYSFVFASFAPALLTYELNSLLHYNSEISLCISSFVLPSLTWSLPNISSCLPSISNRSLSVNIENFCFSFPLISFQFPFNSVRFFIFPVINCEIVFTLQMSETKGFRMLHNP